MDCCFGVNAHLQQKPKEVVDDTASKLDFFGNATKKRGAAEIKQEDSDDESEENGDVNEDTMSDGNDAEGEVDFVKNEEDNSEESDDDEERLKLFNASVDDDEEASAKWEKSKIKEKADKQMRDKEEADEVRTVHKTLLTHLGNGTS